MGNLGSPKLVPVLKAIIKDFQKKEKIRLYAIYALRRVAKPRRNEVRFSDHLCGLHRVISPV